MCAGEEHVPGVELLGPNYGPSVASGEPSNGFLQQLCYSALPPATWETRSLQLQVLAAVLPGGLVRFAFP